MYNPTTEDIIRFKAYHRYLARQRAGIIPHNEDDRKMLEIADWRAAENEIENERAINALCKQLNSSLNIRR